MMVFCLTCNEKKIIHRDPPSLALLVTPRHADYGARHRRIEHRLSLIRLWAEVYRRVVRFCGH